MVCQSGNVMAWWWNNGVIILTIHSQKVDGVCTFDEFWEKNPTNPPVTIVTNSSIYTIMYSISPGWSSTKGGFCRQGEHWVHVFLFDVSLSCLSNTSHSHLCLLHSFIPFLSECAINVLTCTISEHGKLNVEPKHHTLSFCLCADDSGVETFYMLDGAEGSSICWVMPREHLWEVSTVPDRE